MNKRLFVLAHDVARVRAAKFVMDAPEGYCVTVSEPTRSLEQNAALWAKLGEVAAQLPWHGQQMDAASWKCVFTAALKKQDVVPGIDGGYVVLGSPTSNMSKQEMSDLLELITAFGAQHGVQFDEVSA